MKQTNANGNVTLGLIRGLSVVLLCNSLVLAGDISDAGYGLLTQRVMADRAGFAVYLDADSGFNHGFASGEFGAYTTITQNPACIDDPNSPTGCSVNSNALDMLRGTVLQVAFTPLGSQEFAGLNIEEPDDWGVLQTGFGYDLTGATNLVFEVRSPTPGGIALKIGCGGQTTANFIQIPQGTNYTQMTISLASLGLTPAEIADMHILFTVVTDGAVAPAGGIVLLDNIHYEPVPDSQLDQLSFPLSTQTFGVIPVTNTTSNLALPQDQVLRNVTTTYESALSLLALLQRGNPQDLVNARLIADTFHYALQHDSLGDPLPLAPDGSTGLHSAYSSGDLALFNNQQPPAMGLSNDVRLAGFTSGASPTGYSLVLDGATGGNNAWAVLALAASYQQLGETNYLNDALTIGHWIVGNLMDTNPASLGGYFVGYPDGGITPKTLQHSKSVENNAEIFAAFSKLAMIESGLSNQAAAATWIASANAAGDYVMDLFDTADGRFNVGSAADGAGHEVVNTSDFLDADTLASLALAESPRYQNRIDWTRPIQHCLSNFTKTITVGSSTFNGFNLVSAPVSGADGIAWEFTGQAVVTMLLMDRLYKTNTFGAAANLYTNQIRYAQVAAPFGDTQGVVASTMQDGDTLPPVQQCLATPFQRIPERVGLAATAWAIFAEQNLNPLSSPGPNSTYGPDLTGTWANLTQTCVRTQTASRCKLSGQFIVQNIGTTNAGASVVRYYLSTNPTLDASAQLLKQATVSALKPALTKSLSLRVSLPAGTTASGRYVIAVVNATNTVRESNTNNNVIVFGPLP
jgi:hypothetical protein